MNLPNPNLPHVPVQLQSEQADEARMPILSQYVHILRRRQWLVIAIVGLAIMAALVATLLITPKYTAITRLEISREQKNVTNVQGIESEQVGRDLEFYQTQYSLL
jgi:succinoglycan biosynthesis transport protein ExoP